MIWGVYRLLAHFPLPSCGNNSLRSWNLAENQAESLNRPSWGRCVLELRVMHVGTSKRLSRGRVMWNSANHVLSQQALETEPQSRIRGLSLGQLSSTICHPNGQTWSQLQPEVWQGIIATSLPRNIEIRGTRACAVVFSCRR